MIGAYGRIDIHIAGPVTRLAGGAFLRVNREAHGGHTVKQRIKRAERAEIFAERPEYYHAEQDDTAENTGLPHKSAAEKREYARIRECEQQTRESARRAEILAEYGRELYEQRENYHAEYKNEILEKPEDFISPEGLYLFEERYLID